MKNLHLLVILSLLCHMPSFSSDEIKNILYEIQKESDLSKQTKQESVGHVSVFTRSDLDKLRLTSLKELLNYVRFASYTENALGFTDPFYTTKNPAVNDMALKVYLDDRAIYSSYFGTGIQFYGKINLNFIDHIEIYWGVPSFSFGISTGYNVIKLYTKSPTRENSTSIGAYVGSYGTYGVDGISAYEYEDFGYLLSLSGGNLRQKKAYLHKDFALKRDIENEFLYTKFYTKNHSLAFSLLRADYDNFIGFSELIKPEKNYTKLIDIYFSYNYLSDDESLKMYIGYTNGKHKSYDQGNPLIFQSENEKIYNWHAITKEELLDTHIAKVLKFDKFDFEIGFKGRYKHYKVTENKINNINILPAQDYNTEITTSLYAENKYLFNQHNLLVSSIKFDKFFRNADVKNTSSFNARLGYIYNSNLYFFKTFATYSTNLEGIYQFLNYVNFSNYAHKKQELKAINTEFGVHLDKADISLTYGLLSSKNDNEPINLSLYSVVFNYDFDLKNSLKSSFWLHSNRYAKNITKESKRLKKGAYVTLLNTYEKFDFANSLFYFSLDTKDKNFFSLDTTITYNATNNLLFFIKGKNLLGDRLSQTFTKKAYYPVKKETSVDIAMYDRAVYIGFEYSF